MAARIPNPVSPYTALGQSVANLGNAFFAGPTPNERAQQEADTEYRQSVTRASDASAAKAREETDALRRKAAGQSRLAAIFARGMAGMTPDQVTQATQAVLGAGLDPDQAAKAMLFLAGNGGGTDAQRVGALVGAGKPLSGTDAVSIGHQDHIRDAQGAIDLRNKLAVQSASDAAALDRQNHLPVNTGAGDVTTFFPGDPRAPTGQVLGRDTESTAKAGIVNDAAAGRPITPIAQEIVGGTPKNGITVGVDAAGNPYTQIGGPVGSSKLTEAQSTAGFRHDMMDVGNDALDRLATAGYSAPSVVQQALMAQARQPEGGFLSSLINSTAMGQLDNTAQQFLVASQQFIDPFGRTASGAAVNPSEWQSFMLMTVPMAGNTPEVLQQKSIARKAAINAMARSAGMPAAQQWRTIMDAVSRTTAAPPPALGTDGTPQVPTPGPSGAPAGPAATPATAVPPPAQRQAGAVYTTPKGPMRWTGTGWVPASGG